MLFAVEIVDPGVGSRVLQFIVVALMSLWWFGWSGTVFLSSTRVIFGMNTDEASTFSITRHCSGATSARSSMSSSSFPSALRTLMK